MGGLAPSAGGAGGTAWGGNMGLGGGTMGMPGVPTSLDWNGMGQDVWDRLGEYFPSPWASAGFGKRDYAYIIALAGGGDQGGGPWDGFNTRRELVLARAYSWQDDVGQAAKDPYFKHAVDWLIQLTEKGDEGAEEALWKWTNGGGVHTALVKTPGMADRAIAAGRVFERDINLAKAGKRVPRESYYSSAGRHWFTGYDDDLW